VRALQIVRKTALVALSLVGVVTVLATAACLATGLRPVIVLSGSMEPDIATGAVVFHRETPAEELQVGDVVTVARPAPSKGDVTHRIAAIEPAADGVYQLTLRGDANRKDDPQPYLVRNADKAVLDVPHLGTVLLWMRLNPIQTVVALLALLAFALWPATRYTVRLADGRVLQHLTRRQAEAHIDDVQAAGDGTDEADARPAPADRSAVPINR
jgi:signal peptidase